MLISLLEVCQEGGVKKRGTWRTLGGSWLETWRTGLFLTSWMMFFYPNEDTLKILCWYLNYKCIRKGRSRRGVLGGRWGLLTRPMEDVVIPVFMNDVFLSQGRYPEHFVLIYNYKCVKNGGSRRGYMDDIEGSWSDTWRTGSSLMSGMIFLPKQPICISPPEIKIITFQGICFGVKNIINDVKNDPVLHVLGQEPPASSKYPPSWSSPPETHF